MRLNVIIESHIPYADHTIDRVSGVTVRRLPPEMITPESVADADALVIRTRTRCDEALLSGSKVRFIATATIGTDHIDKAACRKLGITVVSAPGCNAPAVAQYVLCSLLRLRERQALANSTLGIVGVGNVGSIVARWASALGIKVLLCDPPRARSEKSDLFTDLDGLVLRSDIITFHVPLTYDGEDATYHMCDDRLLDLCRPGTLIVNAARGGVIDTEALLGHVRRGRIGRPVIDCWEHEPDISYELLELCDIATPHIAGYSVQGKQRATVMALTALGRFFGFEVPGLPHPAGIPATVSASALLQSYDPVADTEALRGCRLPDGFEKLRNTYRLRNEPC